MINNIPSTTLFFHEQGISDGFDGVSLKKSKGAVGDRKTAGRIYDGFMTDLLTIYYYTVPIFFTSNYSIYISASGHTRGRVLAWLL